MIQRPALRGVAAEPPPSYGSPRNPQPVILFRQMPEQLEGEPGPCRVRLEAALSIEEAVTGGRKKRTRKKSRRKDRCDRAHGARVDVVVPGG
jgi:hypothetical protein